jgi:Nuclease-related domain
MSSLVNTLFIAVLWVGPIFFLGVAARLARWWYHERDRRNPLTSGLLRGPGYSLQERLQKLRLDAVTYLAIFSVFPLFALALYFAGLEPGNLTANRFWWVYVLIGLGGICVGAYKLIRLVKRVRNYSLGLEAEMAVGQELNQLMRDGFFVYHDIPGDKAFNLDHVVVGSQGVFAIETKGRSKPVKPKVGEGHRVTYRDGLLRFPGWTEKAPLEQAKRNAGWLGKWLSSAVGVSVKVKPVLMLPGWYIETTSPPGVAVMNGTNCRGYFVKQHDKPLTDELVRQIVHQLDRLCRDVEPRSYRPLQGHVTDTSAKRA